MAKDTTTKEERILIALEYACLLHYEWNQGKKKKLENFYDFLNAFDTMIRPDEKIIPSPQNLERNYRNYLADLESSFDINVSLKKKKVELSSGNSLEEKIFEVLSFYCKYAFQEQNDFHNDKIIQRFVRYRLTFQEVKKEEFLLMETLYLFVFIRYAIKYKLKLECNYKKIMSQEKSNRRLYPVYFASDSMYLSLVANDTKDNLQKQFILANLQIIPSMSLLNEFQKNQKKKETFNYRKFKESKEGNFQRETILYKIKISDFSLEHLLLNYDFPVKVVGVEKDNWKIIELLSSDKIELYKALFGYDVYAAILEPKQARQDFLEKLRRLDSHQI